MDITAKFRVLLFSSVIYRIHMLTVPKRQHHDGRCGKKREGKRQSATERLASTLVPIHPFEIKPLGNVYTASENIKVRSGLFALLADETVIEVFERLDAVTLLRLGCTCKALYAFSRLEELWKTLCLR